MKEQASALDRVCFRFVVAFFFGIPVSLMIICAIGIADSLIGLGLRREDDAWWIYGTMILCIGFGFIFNVMDKLADLVKTKVDDGHEEGEKQ